MEPGSWVVLSVSDTGIGISSEVLPHIYESFYTTKDVGKGTGLGLSQVHEIMRRHDGFIDVESEVGKGTTFFIYLPEWDKDTHLVYRLRETIPRGQDEIILLVEDESIVRAVAKKMLSDLGYGVLATSNGQEALEIYEQHRDTITLVLSDMVMPQMGGIELYRLLCKSNPSIKMILMSGYPPDEDNQELLDQKTVGWIQKPLSFKQLAQVVRETIDG